MPYIKKEQRKKFDELIKNLIEMLKREPVENQDGTINYIVNEILLGVYEPRYFNFNRAMGVLECIKQEFYRRFIAPYENGKIKENGDIV